MYQIMTCNISQQTVFVVVVVVSLPPFYSLRCISAPKSCRLPLRLFLLVHFAGSGHLQCQLSPDHVTNCSALPHVVRSRSYAVKADVFTCTDRWRVALKTEADTITNGWAYIVFLFLFIYKLVFKKFNFFDVS